MDALEFWKISGATALLTAGFSTWVNHWLAGKKEKAAREEDLRYQALRVALALEKFAIDCAGLISDSEFYDDFQGAAGRKATELPKLNLPETTEWKLFEIGTANKILSLENLIADGNNAISFALRISAHHEDTDEPEVQAGLCGYRTVEIAKGLRQKYELVAREEAAHGWDYVVTLKKYHDRKTAVYEQARRNLEAQTVSVGAGQ